MVDLFQVDVLSENLVTIHLNGQSSRIGDVYHIGRKVKPVVGEPRQPCFVKLNHQFSWVHAQKRTLRTRRVGWYLRVLTEGIIEKG